MTSSTHPEKAEPCRHTAPSVPPGLARSRQADAERPRGTRRAQRRARVGKVTLAAGVGAYLTVNQRNFRDKPGPGDGGISGIVSISASYRISDLRLTRVTWNRVVTRYDRDTDVIQAGIGYRF